MSLPIRIRIGASKDASVDAVFNAIRKQARTVAADVARVNERAYDDIIGAARGAAARQYSITNDLLNKVTGATLNAEKKLVAGYGRIGDASEKAARREIRAAENAGRIRSAKAPVVNPYLRRFASNTSHRTTRFFWPNAPIAGVASRVGRDLLHGVGVDTSLSGALQRNVSLESLSTKASNSAKLAGHDVDPATIEARVREVAMKRGLSKEATGSGVFLFQKIASDLPMGLDLLDKMAERATATATDIDDFAGAMANVSKTLGDMPNKGNVLLSIMDAVAVHGAKGAVEVSDMAVQMARVAAAATKFGGVEDRVENIKTMSALGQLARGEGGAPSPAEAARSAVGFANTLQKNARSKAFEKITGVSAYRDAGNTTMKGPMTLIKQALIGTQGDRKKLNKIFADTVGARIVDPFIKAFNATKGGDKEKLAAVDAVLASLRDNETLSQSTLDANNAARAKTTEFKTQQFQNALDDLVAKMQNQIGPSLAALAPIALGAAEKLGKLAKFVFNNPIEAGGVAVAAAGTRAAVESLMRVAIEKAIIGMFGGAAGAAAGTAVVGAAGAATTGTGMVAGAASLVGPVVAALLAAGVIALVVSAVAKATKKDPVPTGDNIDLTGRALRTKREELINEFNQHMSEGNLLGARGVIDDMNRLKNKDERGKQIISAEKKKAEERQALEAKRRGINHGKGSVESWINETGWEIQDLINRSFFGDKSQGKGTDENIGKIDSKKDILDQFATAVVDATNRINSATPGNVDAPIPDGDYGSSVVPPRQL